MEALYVTRGVRLCGRAKKCLALQLVTPEEAATGTAPAAPVVLFAHKEHKHFSLHPGNVYRVEIGDTPNTIRPATAKYEQRWPDDAMRVAWAAESRAQERAQQAEAIGVKEGKIDPLRERLAPLRAQYLRLRGAARAQLIAAVVQEIARD